MPPHNPLGQVMTSTHRLQHVAGVIGVLLSALSARADDWPQWRGPNRDGVWHETGILDRFPADGLKVRWRAPVGPGYSSPVVAQGRVFVTDWVLGPRAQLKARERVHCFEEATGKPLWTYSYDIDCSDWAFGVDNPGGPTSTPIVQGGKVYTVGLLGHLFCFDALKGEVLWKKDLARDYRAGQVRGSPLIEGNLLIVQADCGKPKAGVVAFDKDSGKEIWKALDAAGQYSSPLVIEAGGKRQLIVSSGDWVTSLDPATGKTYWREKFTGRNIPTPVFSRNRLLVNGLMFALDSDKPAASVLWPDRKPNAQPSDTTTAIFRGDLVFSHKRDDRLVCLDMNTGKQLWETDRVKSSMHSLALCGDGVFVFTDQGELIRADLSARGYKEVSRTALIKPTSNDGNHMVVYAAPAYANRQVFARNDEELICASLAAEP
jgi:outer membrane protein assembly factor BamB